MTAAVLTALGATNTTGAPPATGDWTIDASVNENVQNMDIDMTGNITVNALGTLVLKNCTLTFKLQWDGQYGIYVNTGGVLVIENCRIKSNNSNYRYTFWMDTNSDVTLRWDTISDVHDGILINTDVATVYGCVIYDCDDGVEVIDSSPDIEDNRILNNDHRGIFIRTTGAATPSPNIEGNQIYNNQDDGIWVGDATPYIYDNTIWSNWDDGIFVHDCFTTFQINSNRIRLNGDWGISIDRSIPFVAQNTIEANRQGGIYVWGDFSEQSTPIINNNDIIGNGGSGVWLDNEWVNGVQIDDNDIYNNLGWGIYARGGDFTRNNNVFSDTSGVGNRQGRMIQLWRLEVQETLFDTAGFYLYNDNLWNGWGVFSGNGLDYYNFGYRGDYEIYNDGTTFDYGTYMVVADETGGYMIDTASTALNGNTVLDITLAPAPELEISDLSWSNPTPAVGDTVTVTVDVMNTATTGLNGADASNVVVECYYRQPDEGVVNVGRKTVASVARDNGVTQTTFDITFTNGGTFQVFAVADPDNAIWEETDTDSNPVTTRQESLSVSGHSAFVAGVETYVSHPYWSWRWMNEQDSASTDPGQWRSFLVTAGKFSGLNDASHIVETHNPAWDVVITFSSSSSGNPINYVSMPSWQSYRSFYVHVRPPGDAARGSNLNMDLKLESDNNTVASEAFHLDCYANWIIPAGTTQTASADTVANMEYGVKVYGTLELDNADWTFNNYPQQKEITIYDGGFADFDGVTMTGSDPSYQWRFFVYGDLELTNSDISGTDYGIEIDSASYPANVLIDGNDIHDNDHDGITIHESYAVIQNNRIYDNLDAGIDGTDSFGDALIQNNDIYSNNDEGIWMALKSDRPIRVLNNTLRSNGEGMVIDSFSEVFSKDNLIYSNTHGLMIMDHGELDSNSDIIKMQSHDGLQMDSYGRATITDAQVNYNGRSGVWATYKAELTVQTSSIEKNGEFAMNIANSRVEVWDSAVMNTAIHGSYNNDDDIRLDNDAVVIATNTSMDRARLYVEDDDSYLTVRWYLQVQTVDVNDNGVEDMHVNVTNGQGEAVFDGNTDEDGYTPVMISKEITINGTGSVVYMFTDILVSNGVDIDQEAVVTGNTLVMITLNHAAFLTVMENDILARPTETISYNLTVYNIGILDDTLDISVAGSDIYKPELDITTADIESGGLVNITLNVSIPQRSVAWENETFIVTAASQGDAGMSYSIPVYARTDAFKEVFILAVHETFNATPGTDQMSWFEVMNTGTVPDTFTFTAEVQGARLTDPVMTITPGSREVQPYDTVMVLVNTTIPNGTLVGVEYLTLTAASTDEEATDSATVSLVIDQVFSAGLNQPDLIEVVAGDADVYTLNLTNLGNGPDVFALSSDSEYLSFSEELVSLGVGEGAQFDLTVAPPLDLNTTSIEVNIIALSADGLSRHYFPVTLNITARIWALEVKTPFDAIELEQGFLKEFDITLYNGGNTWEQPVLSFAGMDDWTATLGSNELVVLMNATNSTGFTMQVPEDADLGEITLTFTADYAGTTATKTVVVTVIEKNEVLEWSEVPAQDAAIRGRSKTITLTLTNTGNYTHMVYLSLVDEKNVGTLDIYSFELAPGGSQEVVLTITVPRDFDPDKLDVQVVATYGYNNEKTAAADAAMDVETAWAGTIALIVIMLLLGIIIGAAVLFLLVKQGIIPGLGKKEDEDEEGRPKAKKKVKKKKTAGEGGEEGEGLGLEGVGGPMEGLPDGELPPGVAVGEDGELAYSEEQQMSPEEMEAAQGEDDGLDGGAEEEEEEGDLKDMIEALAQEEGVTEAVEEEMEAMDDLDADIAAMMLEEDIAQAGGEAGGEELAEMESITPLEETSIEPLPEAEAADEDDLDITLPDDFD